MGKILLLKIFLLIAIQTSIFGTTYYVSKSGNDSYVGSEEYPWKTLKKGFDSLHASDTLLIRGGTYYPTTMLYPGVKNGASNESERITVKNYPNEEVWIDGTNIVWSQPGNDQYMEGIVRLMNYRSYVTIDGIGVKNSQKIGIQAGYYTHNIIIKNCHTLHTGASGIYISGVNNSIIEYNEIENSTYLGDQEMITVYKSDNNIIRYNHVHHGGNENAHINGLGIDLKNGVSNTDVYGNIIHDIQSHGIYIDSLGDTHGIRIFNNKIYNISGNGIQVATEAWNTGDPIANDIQIFNNILYDINSHAIRVGYSSRNYNYFYNINITNNTIYNIGYAGIVLYMDQGDHPAHDIYVTNNIIRKTGQRNATYYFDIQFEAAHGTGVSIERNAIERELGDIGINYLTNDPLFVDAANINFRLQKDSPLINTGTSLYFTPSTDFDEKTRNNENGITLGAFESEDNIDTTVNHFVIGKDSLRLVEDQ